MIWAWAYHGSPNKRRSPVVDGDDAPRGAATGVISDCRFPICFLGRVLSFAGLGYLFRRKNNAIHAISGINDLLDFSIVTGLTPTQGTITSMFMR